MVRALRAHRPGEDHRFSPGSPICMHCGTPQSSVAIKRMCLVGVLYDFSEGQGRFKFDRARTLVRVGVYETDTDVSP